MEANFKTRLRVLMNKKGFIVKELAAKAGVSKRSLDNYFSLRGSIPAADIAVKIAQALDTTVEYLVTGIDSSSGVSIEPDDLDLIKKLHFLDDIDRKVVNDLIQSFINRKEFGASAMDKSKIG